MEQLTLSISIVKFGDVFSHKHVEVCAGKKFRSGIKKKKKREKRIETVEC